MDIARRGRNKARAPWLVALLLLGGCTAPLSRDLRASIQSVSIAQDVMMPDKALVFWRGSWGCECRSHHQERVRAATQHLGRVARAALVEELERSGIFRSIVSERGDAEIQSVAGGDQGLPRRIRQRILA